MRKHSWKLLLGLILIVASLFATSIVFATIDTSGGWRLPFNGTMTITCAPGERPNFQHGQCDHVNYVVNGVTIKDQDAIDYANGATFPVLAPADGVVFDTLSSNTGYGNRVRINHNGTYSFFAHLSQILVNSNQSVTQGQQIGTSGMTGNATGIHLHFDARVGATLGDFNSGNPIMHVAIPGNWFNPWYSPVPNLQWNDNKPSGGAQYPESRIQPSTLLDPNGRHLSNNQSPPNLNAAWMSDISDSQATLHFGAAPNTPNTVWATTFQVYEMLASCGGCWQAIPGGPNITAPTFTEAQGSWNQSDPNGQHTYLSYDSDQHDGQGTIARYWDFWTGNSSQRIPHISAVYRAGTDTTVLEYCASNAVQYSVWEYHGSDTQFTYGGQACSILVHRNLNATNMYIVTVQYTEGTWSPWTIWLVIHF